MSDYGDRLLSDDQIAAMSPAQRRDLIQRLERPLDEVFPPAVARRMRRNRLTLMVVGAAGLAYPGGGGEPFAGAGREPGVPDRRQIVVMVTCMLIVT